MDKFELELSSALQGLRVPVKLKGYELIKSAMRVLRNNLMAIHSVMGLYQVVAQKHNTTAKKVESNIRSALQGARSDFATQKKVLGTNRELSNKEFLATLHEVIKIKMAGAREEA